MDKINSEKEKTNVLKKKKCWVVFSPDVIHLIIPEQVIAIGDDPPACVGISWQVMPKVG